jgi:hypothetical protein
MSSGVVWEFAISDAVCFLLLNYNMQHVMVVYGLLPLMTFLVPAGLPLAHSENSIVHHLLGY